MLELGCPKCGSENTQKLSLAVEGGTHRTSGTTMGVGATGGGMGMLAAQTSGTSTSELASKHSAPTKTPVIRGSIAILIFSWLISLFAGPWALTIGWIIIAVVAFTGWRYNFGRFHRDLEEWNKRYLCLRCSDVFIPGSNSAIPSTIEASQLVSS